MRSVLLIRTYRMTVCLLAALILIAVSAMLVQAAPAEQSASDGKTLFDQKCAACHSVGGGAKVGPDLKGVTTKRDMAWLKEVIVAPDRLIASGDADMAQLLKEFNNIPMPNLGVTEQQADDILAYLAESANGSPPAAPPAQPGGADVVARMSGDAAFGRKLFTGAEAFTAGGTACISCHHVDGLGALGGGTLGPDLTKAYSQYGRETVANMLVGMPFPTMRGIFDNHPLTPMEQADLLAFLVWVDQQGRPQSTATTILFLSGGAILAFGLFAGMLFFWPRQRQSVSEKLRKGA